ncbi:hypothetical protein [Labilibaculum sp.]|uniref:hypothetical protein n=1 Tax=Labilibaculum sp. TaxID=2060723 RepID=UPI003563FC16
MNKDLLYALIQNPYLIPGIYNYCDGWCERCDFTNNCLNYKMMEEGVPDLESANSEAEEAMDNLDEMFQISMELLKQAAKDLGMEMPEKSEDFDSKAEEAKDDLIFKSSLMTQADSYSDMVDKWFVEFEGLLYVGSGSLKELLDYTDEEEMSKEEQDIFNIYEIIRWYQFIIPSKLFRSLRSKAQSEETGNEFYQHDSIASGKVALLSIDKSIEAWTVFMHEFPEAEDSMLPLLLLLSGLRSLVEKKFPDSREFIRPGFDI